MGFSLLFHAAPMAMATSTLAVDDAPPLAAPAPALARAVTLTAYNAVPAQTDSSPFETASGAYSNPAVVAARSADLARTLPFGTIIEIDGSNITSPDTCGFGAVESRIGYRVIADAMNPRFTKRVDVLLPTPAQGSANPAETLGICKGVTIRVVGHVAIGKIPETQAALAALVDGSAGAHGDLALQ